MSGYGVFEEYIKDKSGVDVEIYGDADFPSRLKQIADKINNGLYADAESKKTYFTVYLNGKSALASVDGISPAEERLVGLIKELAENFSVKDGLTKTEFYGSLLRGELNAAQVKRFAVKFRIPETPVSVMIITMSGESLLSAKEVIENYGDDKDDSLVELNKNEFALVKFSDVADDDYRSQREYAEYLLRTVYEETGVILNVYVGGRVKRLAELSSSFIQARTAQSFDTSNEFKKVRTYREYALLGMVQDIPKSKLKEYFDLLEGDSAKQIFADKEMLDTAEEFLNNNLNVSETSRSLFLHRNTLSYRLDKIERATGLNIRRFSDAVTFRLLTYLNELLK